MDFQPNTDSTHSIDICSTKTSSCPVQSNFTVDSIGVIKSCRPANITRLSSNTWGSSHCGLALSPKSRMITKSSLSTCSHHDFNHRHCHHHLNHVCNLQQNEIKIMNSSPHCRYTAILNGQQQLRLDEYNYDYVHDVVEDEQGDMISCSTEPKVYSSRNLACPVVDNEYTGMPVPAIDASPPTPALSSISNNSSSTCCHSSLEQGMRSPSLSSLIPDFAAMAAAAPVPPIRVVQIDNPVRVTTDATNFRSLVQKLTGKSGVSSKQWHRLRRKLKSKADDDIEPAPALLESSLPSDHLNSWHQVHDKFPEQDQYIRGDDDDWNDYDVDQLFPWTTDSSAILKAEAEIYMNQPQGQLTAAASSSCSGMGADDGHLHDSHHGLNCTHTDDAHNQHYMDINAHNQNYMDTNAHNRHYIDNNAQTQHYMDNAHIHVYVAELGEPATDQGVCCNGSIHRCNQNLLQQQWRQDMVMHHSEQPFSELDIYAGLVSDGPLPDIIMLPPLLKNLPEHHYIHHHHHLLAPPAHNTAYMPLCI